MNRLHRASSTIVLVLSLLPCPARGQGRGDPSPPPPPPPPPILSGGGLVVFLDEAAGTFVVSANDGVELVRLPIGVAALPSLPRQRYALDGEPERVALVPNEDGSGIDGAILTLVRAESDVEVAIGLRSVDAGVLVSFGVPGAAFASLDRSDSIVERDGVVRRVSECVPRISVAATEPRDAVVFEGDSALVLRGSRISGSGGAYRFSGVVAAPDDASDAAEVRIESGDETVFRSGRLQAGETAAFDVALESDRAVRLSTSQGGRVVVGEGTLRFGDSDATLSDLVADSSQALELFAGGTERIQLGEGAVILGAIDGAELAGEVIDVRRGGPFVPPYMMIVRAREHYLGIGLATLSDANAFLLIDGRLTLAMPTRRLATAPPLPNAIDPDGAEAPGGTIVALALLHATTRNGLLAEYRDLLIQARNSGAIRETAGAANPAWWREPVIRIAPRPPITFDALEVQQVSEDIAARLGAVSFTTLVDGPWSSRPGDLEAAAGFETLRSVIAKCHVGGRHLLLAIDTFAASPGSYADLMGLASDSILDTTDLRTHERYAKEVARRVVSRAGDAFGADGIVLRNVAGLRDATSEAPIALPAAGLGLNELARHVEKLHDGLAAHFDESLLLAPIALPQVVEWYDGILIDGNATGRLGDAIDTAAAVLPDQPLFIELPTHDASDAEFLKALGAACVWGTPVVDARRLLALDESAARVATALLAIVAQRPTGIATRHADGRARMSLDGRELAEEIGDRNGIVVYPARDAALLVSFVDGALELPFQPATTPDGLTIEFGAKGARLQGGRAGVIYRFGR